MPRTRFALLMLAACSLAACTGISTVHLVTNGPGEVSVDGQNLGPAPVTFPLPWRNIDNNINYSSRTVRVTSNGKVVYDRDISGDIAAKAQTGDFQDGSQYGTGRTYTLSVDINAAAKPSNRP